MARYIVFINVPCVFAHKLLATKFFFCIFSSSLMAMWFKSAMLLCFVYFIRRFLSGVCKRLLLDYVFLVSFSSNVLELICTTSVLLEVTFTLKTINLILF